MGEFDDYVSELDFAFRAFSDGWQRHGTETVLVDRDDAAVDRFTELLERYFATSPLVFDDLRRSAEASGWCQEFETVTGVPLRRIVASLAENGPDRSVGAVREDLDANGIEGCGAQAFVDTVTRDPCPPVDVNYDEHLLKALEFPMIRRFGERVGPATIEVVPDTDFITRLHWRSPLPADLLWDHFVNRAGFGAEQRDGTLRIDGASEVFRDEVLPAFSTVPEDELGFPENHAHFSGTVPQRFLWVSSLFDVAGVDYGDWSGLAPTEFRALMKWCRFVLLRLAAHGLAVDDFRTGDVDGDAPYDEVFEPYRDGLERAFSTVERQLAVGRDLGLFAKPDLPLEVDDSTELNFGALEWFSVGSGSVVEFEDAPDSSEHRLGHLFSYLWIRAWFNRTATYWFAGRDAGLAPFMEQYDRTTWATEVEDWLVEAEGVDRETLWTNEMRRRVQSELVEVFLSEPTAPLAAGPFDATPIVDLVKEYLTRRATDDLTDVYEHIAARYRRPMDDIGRFVPDFVPPADDWQTIVDHAQERSVDLRRYNLNTELVTGIFHHALANRVSSLELRSTLPKEQRLPSLLSKFLPLVNVAELYADSMREAEGEVAALEDYGQSLSTLWPEDITVDDAERYPGSFGIVLTLRKGGPFTWTGDELLEAERSRLEWFLQAAPDEVANCIVGVDAAASERGAAPHLFEPHYSLAERHGLGKTFHAGEDYGDLLTGLRYVHQAVEVLGCSRIGHGLALAEPPESAYRGDVDRRLRRFRTMAEENGTSIHDERSGGGAGCLGGFVEDVVDTARWLERCTPFDPSPYASALSGSGLSVPDEYARAGGKARPVGRPLDDVVVVDATDEVLDLASRTQTWVREHVAATGTVVESCPQSNRVIGNLLTMAEHPALTTFPDADVRHCINTDDLGVFGTSLPVEFWRLYRYRDATDQSWVSRLDEWLETGRAATFVDD